MASESERTIVNGLGICIGLLVGIYALLLPPTCSRNSDTWHGFVWPDAKDPMNSFTVGEYKSEASCAAANERAIVAMKRRGLADSVCKLNCKPLAFSASREVCEGDILR